MLVHSQFYGRSGRLSFPAGYFNHFYTYRIVYCTLFWNRQVNLKTKKEGYENRFCLLAFF